ncbi:MAG TPA: DUF3866 family protein [Firmicutes bacterium]|nr:DUF3866 family protein [Bacillota bacterium]
MIETAMGTVENILWSRKGIQCLEVSRGETREKAINYPPLTGTALPGQKVILNTAAITLGLGSGGYHFVIANEATNNLTLSPGGHIMKLRYTPLQLKVQVYEEFLKDKNPLLAKGKYRGLKGVPVVIGELHSMLAPFVLALKRLNPERKIAYVMTDSAALPLYLSNTVHRLKGDSLLEGTVTCGHAFGGDLETVNIYTALMAAKEELGAEVIVIMPGPGVVGTSTRYGFSGVEQGEHIDRIRKMGGTPVLIPRISFSDKRARHIGLSHHTLTVLGEISSGSAYLPLPVFDRKKMLCILYQLKKNNLFRKHRVEFIKSTGKLQLLKNRGYDLRTMGRRIGEDPAFFIVAATAAFFTEKLYTRKNAR